MADIAGRILVLGGLNLDFVLRAQRLPVAGETVTGDAFETTRGGKAGNQVVAAARMLDDPSRIAMVGRVGAPEDLAAAVTFLASPEAGFTTAQVLTVDGGRKDYIGHG